MSAQRDQALSISSHVSEVGTALDAALARTIREESQKGTPSMDLSSARYIIFSDLHRGARNGADDFLRAERAYNAALSYYLRMGHTLVVLGDVEELWEERPASVVKAYKHSLALESQFHHKGRYVRIRGNHDDEWQFTDRVRLFLSSLFGGPQLDVRESTRIVVTDKGEELGALFLIHGHQGDAWADAASRVAKIFVRYVWRPFQRLTRLSFNTPAESWELREKHNSALYSWAEKQSKLILIAGHTHRPVFKSQSHVAQLLEEVERLEKEAESRPSRILLEAQAVLLAKIEWVLAQERQKPDRETRYAMTKPCYFNTGCCSFLDGDITGIEIVDGMIRLIRWPDKEGSPKPHTLAKDSLRDVLAAC